MNRTARCCHGAAADDVEAAVSAMAPATVEAMWALLLAMLATTTTTTSL